MFCALCPQARQLTCQQQLTCELLRYPALEGVPLGTGQPAGADGSDDSAAACSYIFEPLLRCVAWVVDQVSQPNLGACVWPRVLQLCKLIPVLKSGQASDPNNKDMYRGISVSSIYSRVMERLSIAAWTLPWRA
jgi:hypothetical protein